jgi:acetamidase/formamidase
MKRDSSHWTVTRPSRRSRAVPSAVVGPPARPVAVTLLALLALLAGAGCTAGSDAGPDGRDGQRAAPEPESSLTADQTHSRWSRTIEPVLRVRPGAVVEVFTEEASDGQLTPESTADDLADLSFDPIHPLTGPVYVEGAEPGDLLAVTLHTVEVGDWGWSAVVPGFGFLADEYDEPYLKTYRFEPGDSTARFNDRIEVPLRPFPGVVGVAPDTDSLLSTIPPRRNGGNMDDRDIVEGTTIYLPVLVEGALLSVGDGHAAQGDGEVSGTAIEAPLRIVYQVELIRDPGFELPSPQYLNERGYFVTGIAETIDEATRAATRNAIAYLVRQHGLSPTEAYVLASTAGHLKIAEVVDVPNMMVTMRLPREILPEAPGWSQSDGTVDDDTAR